METSRYRDILDREKPASESVLADGRKRALTDTAASDMVYTKSDAPVQKSIDTASAEPANAQRYRGTSAQVYLNPDGLPVAFQPGGRPRQPGSFAAPRRVRLVTPQATTPLSRARFEAYRSRCAPLN